MPRSLRKLGGGDRDGDGGGGVGWIGGGGPDQF